MTNLNSTARIIKNFNRDFAVHQAKLAAAALRGPIDPDATFELNPAGTVSRQPSTETFELNPTR